MPMLNAREVLIASLAFSLVAISTVAMADEANLQVPEKSTVRTLPASNPHRVFVYDPDFPHLTATTTYVIDGDKGKVVGMMSSGYQSNLAFSPDQKEIYIADTYYSRLTRGKRTDIVTYYDTKTLTPKGETKLPKGRFLVVTKKYNADTTPDGKYILSFNSTPATSVSVVDAESHKYLGEINSRGCSLVFPSGKSSFVSICANGSLLSVDFAVENGELKTNSGQEGKPFFDTGNDPVFETPGFDKESGTLKFVSYKGKVYPVDISGKSPAHGESWSLFKDTESGWVPGGWMPVAYHAKSDHLFVLVHKGGKWTHKFPSTEVWVYDCETHKRISRIKLKEPAASIAVSPDSDTQLYALSESAELDIYDAKSGEHLHTVDQMGASPLVLYTAGD